MYVWSLSRVTRDMNAWPDVLPQGVLRITDRCYEFYHIRLCFFVDAPPRILISGSERCFQNLMHRLVPLDRYAWQLCRIECYRLLPYLCSESSLANLVSEVLVLLSMHRAMYYVRSMKRVIPYSVMALVAEYVSK